MSTEAERLGTGSPGAKNGTFGGLAGRSLSALFRARSREIPTAESGARGLPEEGPLRDAGKPRPAMDAGITGGMSLLVGGQTGPGRRGG